MMAEKLVLPPQINKGSRKIEKESISAHSLLLCQRYVYEAPSVDDYDGWFIYYHNKLMIRPMMLDVEHQ